VSAQGIRLTREAVRLPPLRIAFVVGESSGDQLGARLMESLIALSDRPVVFAGVGGPLMEAGGLRSLFPMSDIAVNGLMPVIRRLPLLLRRIREASDAIAQAKPDAVVLIDAQDFNKRVAKRLKRLAPEIPIVGYVSPTVWAWRAGRARKLKPLLARLLAVLPFEPAVHARLGGPDTLYVGHPLMERRVDWQASAADQAQRDAAPYRLLLLPGSRRAEVSRLMPVFGEAVALLASRNPGLQVLLPVVPHLKETVMALAANWQVRPQFIEGEEAKWQAFRTARAALAASGTVTLELALARVPTVVAYIVSYIEGEIARRMITAQHAALPNIMLDRRAIPEFIDWGWGAEDLANTISPLLDNSPERTAQMAAFDQVEAAMQIDGSPSEHAARAVLEILQK
jgi:lipid-A-disaccharide synthase